MSYVSGGVPSRVVQSGYHSRIKHNAYPQSMNFASLLRSSNSWIKDIERVAFRPNQPGSFDVEGTDVIEIPIVADGGCFLDGRRSYLTAQIRVTKPSVLTGANEYHSVKFLNGHTDWIDTVQVVANTTGKILCEVRDYNRLCAIMKKYKRSKETERIDGWMEGKSDLGDANGRGIVDKGGVGDTLPFITNSATDANAVALNAAMLADKNALRVSGQIGGARDLEWTELIAGQKYEIVYNDRAQQMNTGAGAYPAEFIAVLNALTKDESAGDSLFKNEDFGSIVTNGTDVWWCKQNAFVGFQFRAAVTGPGFVDAATYPPAGDSGPVGKLRDAILAWKPSQGEANANRVRDRFGTADNTASRPHQLYGKIRFRRVQTQKNGLEENLFRVGDVMRPDICPGSAQAGSFQVKVNLEYLNLLNHTMALPVTFTGGYRLRIKLAMPKECMVLYNKAGVYREIREPQNVRYSVSNIKYQAQLVYMTDPFLAQFKRLVASEMMFPFVAYQGSRHVPRGTNDEIRVASNIKYVRSAMMTWRNLNHRSTFYRNGISNFINGGLMEWQYSSGGHRYPQVEVKLTQSLGHGTNVDKDAIQPKPTVEGFLEAKKAFGTMEQHLQTNKMQKDFWFPPRIMYPDNDAYTQGNKVTGSAAATYTLFPMSHAEARTVTSEKNRVCAGDVTNTDKNVGVAVREHWDGAHIVAADFTYKNQPWTSFFNRVDDSNKGNLDSMGGGNDLYVSLKYSTDPSQYNLEMQHWLAYDNAIIIRGNGDITAFQQGF